MILISTFNIFKTPQRFIYNKKLENYIHMIKYTDNKFGLDCRIKINIKLANTGKIRLNYARSSLK